MVAVCWWAFGTPSEKALGLRKGAALVMVGAVLVLSQKAFAWVEWAIEWVIGAELRPNPRGLPAKPPSPRHQQSPQPQGHDARCASCSVV